MCVLQGNEKGAGVPQNHLGNQAPSFLGLHLLQGLWNPLDGGMLGSKWEQAGRAPHHFSYSIGKTIDVTPQIRIVYSKSKMHVQTNSFNDMALSILLKFLNFTKIWS